MNGLDEGAMAGLLRLRRLERKQLEDQSSEGNVSPELWVCPICGSRHFDMQSIQGHTLHCSEKMKEKAIRLIGHPVKVPVEGAGPGIVISNDVCRVVVRYPTARRELAWDNCMIPAVVWTKRFNVSELTELTEEEYNKGMEDLTKTIFEKMNKYFFSGL